MRRPDQHTTKARTLSSDPTTWGMNTALCLTRASHAIRCTDNIWDSWSHFSLRLNNGWPARGASGCLGKCRSLVPFFCLALGSLHLREYMSSRVMHFKRHALSSQCVFNSVYASFGFNNIYCRPAEILIWGSPVGVIYVAD